MFTVSTRPPAILLVVVLAASFLLAAPGDGQAGSVAGVRTRAPSTQWPAANASLTPPPITPIPDTVAVPVIAALAAGERHTCALTTSGRVLCWGANLIGQLGRGPTADYHLPIGVLGLPARAAAIAAGYEHTCALLVDGRVACWGGNARGQLGAGSRTYSDVPRIVGGLDGPAVAISLGLMHSCAVLASGRVECWGYNGSGQLGDGTWTDSAVPVEVTGLDGITAIAAGGLHTCALTQAGGVMCWGNALGVPAVNDNSLTPVETLGPGSGATTIAAGGNHTCAITKGGTLTCWGWNASGQLGTGRISGSGAPGRVVGLGGAARSITAGSAHTCAVTVAGRALCWGYGHFGILGDGSTTTSAVPVEVLGLASGAIGITAGGSHTCAVASSGVVTCWGRNGYGQLGDGGRTNYVLRPVAVAFARAADAVASIAAGSSHTCALTGGGHVMCWGYNAHGELGNGTTATSVVPADVVGLPSDVTGIAVGGLHTCAVTGSGGVMCWGHNDYGQLGNGSTMRSLTPVGVSGLGSGVIAIAIGGYRTCALTAVGGVKCWGFNGYGQLGNGTTGDGLIPVDVIGLDHGVMAIAAGPYHTCALMAAGAVKCWGAGGMGQLGNGTKTERSLRPVDVSGLGTPVTAIAAGYQHTCAVTAAGAVECWGYNSHGELGNGTTTASSVPVGVTSTVGGIRAVGAGGLHTCALTYYGPVWCWGSNNGGQLGDGSTVNRRTPVEVMALLGAGPGPATISVGGGHTCALLADGAVTCWGQNHFGQLGTGSRKASSLPVAVDFRVRPTVTVRPSTPAGIIPAGTTITFTATVHPLAASGARAAVRFAVSLQDRGVWRLAAQRDVTADVHGVAILRWTFATAGPRSLRVRAIPDATYAGSAWTPAVAYDVR